MGSRKSTLKWLRKKGNDVFEQLCIFCGKSQSKVGLMIQGDLASICSECVTQAYCGL
ncbi:MAG: ClpX C4-type zinc finger protein [Saprospiraceae bacterium]|nr:ClpX C4-type zinc finger protein [Saprospiraceae bacterium]